MSKYSNQDKYFSEPLITPNDSPITTLDSLKLKSQVDVSHPWREYADSRYDSPVCNRFLSSPKYYKLRWKILNVFYTRICCGIVLGEIVFFLLLLGVFIGMLVITGQKVESTGSIAGYPATLAFTFACRNSIWILLTGLPFERSLKWHKLSAYIAVAIGIWHAICSNELNISGLALIGGMGALIIFSFWPIRRKRFETFYRIHWIMIIVTVSAAFFHDATELAPGIMLFTFDLVCRVYIIYFSSPKKTFIVRLPSNVVRITFKKKKWNYKAGQYCFIRVPGVSLWEYHPFSISSSPHEENVSLHIRVLGDWTKKLYEFAAESREININIDGPYGAPCLDIDSNKYQYFLFVSGGIGITPMQSICNDIMYQFKRGRIVKKVMFVWSVRDLFMVDSVLEYDKEYIKMNHQKNLPISFQPDLLNREVDKEVMENYFHLTQERDASKYEEANVHPNLQPNLKFGRPDLNKLFQKMKKYCKGGRVAVLTCGPKDLVNDTLKFCVEHTGDGVIFDFHKELFQF